MIRITINNEPIEIDQELQVLETNPWFSDDIIGEFSYPVSGPLTPNTKRIFGTAKSLPCYVNADGIFIKNCTLTFKTSKLRWQGAIKYDLGEIIPSLKKNLSDLVNSTIIISKTEFGWTLQLQAVNGKTQGSYPVCFPIIKNPSFISPDFTPTNTNLDFYDYGGFLNQGTDTTINQGNFIVPQVNIIWLLRHIFANLGFTIQGEFSIDEEVLTWILYCNVAIDLKDADTQMSIDLAKILPTYSLSDLLKALIQDESIGIFLNAMQKTVEFKRLTTTIGESDYVDGRGIELEGYEYINQEEEGYTIEPYLPSSDRMNKARINPSPQVIGEGDQEITAKIAAPYMTSSNNMLLPEIDQPGNIIHEWYSEAANYINPSQKGRYTLHNNPPLMIMSFRGMSPFISGVLTYAYATTVNYDATNATIGPRALSFDGSVGKFNEVFRKVYGFLDKSRELESDLLIPAHLFTEIKLSKKIMLQYEGRSRKYLIKEITKQFPLKNGKIRANARLLEISLKNTVTKQLSTDQDIYIELVQSNIQFTTPTPEYDITADYNIKVYLDAQLSILANNSSLQSFIVYIRVQDSNGLNEIQSFSIANNNTQIFNDLLIETTNSDNGNALYTKTLTIEPDSAYNS